jgi:hypothetical protein
MEGFPVSGFSDILGSIGTSIASFAPTIAGMLGGPLAATGVQELEKVLGISPAASSDLGTRAQSIADALAQGKLTGDQIVQLKLAETRHSEFIAQNNIDLAKLNAAHQEAGWNADVQDRASARERQIAVKDNTPAYLAYSIIGGAFAISIAQLAILVGWGDAVNKIPAQGWLLIGNMSGYLWAEAKAATSYFFGTTSSSRVKDDTIATQAQAASQ